jgi:hypothetical protein
VGELNNLNEGKLRKIKKMKIMCKLNFFSQDLVFTFFSYFLLRFPIMFPELFLRLELPNWVIALGNFICGYTFVSDNLAMAFILANRYTAIGRPMTHKHVNNQVKIY